MNNLFFIIFTMITSGLEPFIGRGSLMIAFAGAAGVKKNDWWGISGMFLAGLIRDVLFVERLGIGPMLLSLVWAIAAMCATRFDRPILIAVLSALFGSFVLSIMSGALDWPGMLATGLYSMIISAMWMWLGGRSGDIRLRNI